MHIIALIVFLLAIVPAPSELRFPSSQQVKYIWPNFEGIADDNEAMCLLKILHKKWVRDGYVYVSAGPTREQREEVYRKLLRMAEESQESRAQVVQAAVNMIDDPEAEEEVLFPEAWLTAVRLAADLKAVEAVDALVRNIYKTGQHAIIASIHIRPVVSALIRIGEPAVPRLIEALSDSNVSIRMEASWTLLDINPHRAKTAFEQVLLKETDETMRNHFNQVLSYVPETISAKKYREES